MNPHQIIFCFMYRRCLLTFVHYRITVISAQVWYSTPNLNNNWMTAVIDQSRHLTGWVTLRLVGGRTPDLDRYQWLYLSHSEGALLPSNTSLGILRAKPKCNTCLLVKQADTTFWQYLLTLQASRYCLLALHGGDPLTDSTNSLMNYMYVLCTAYDSDSSH